MSNKASNQVHELIQSLSPAEKRYFRLFAERHSGSGKNNYQLLFEAMERQKVYDENTLLKQFKNEPFVKHFSIAKNRLYHQLLKSLDMYHAESSSATVIGDYLHYVEILFQKNLHKQCERLLSSAEKMAEKHENYPALLKILEWKNKLVETKNYESDEADILNRQEDYLRKLWSEKEIREIKTRVFKDLFRSGQARSGDKASVAKDWIDRLESQTHHSNDFESTYLLLHTKSAIFFSLAQYKKCRRCLLELKSMILEKQHIAKDNPLNFHTVLINLAHVSAKLNLIEEAMSYLEESKNLSSQLKVPSTPYLEFRLFADASGLELAISNLTGNIERGKKLAETIPDGLEKWDSQLSEVKRAAFLHELSVMQFMLGNSKHALKWNNELLNSIDMNKSEDQVLFGQMFHAVLQIEKCNFELLASVEKSLRRFLTLRDKQYAFESHFLELIRKLKANDENTEDYQDFLENIKSLEHTPFEKVAFEYFDFVAWAESKIYDVPFLERVKDRIALRDVL